MFRQSEPDSNMEAEELFKKRAQELARTAYVRGIVTFTDFLDMNEINIIHTINWKASGVSLKLFGGYEMAERQIAAFVPEALSYIWEYPIVCLCIKPDSARYAEVLSHRDYLGSVLNLGLNRGKIGDIMIDEKSAYIFVHEKIASFLQEQLIRVRHTSVWCEPIMDMHTIPRPKTTEIRGTVASIRLDSVIALAFSTSRNSILPFIEGGKVFVNGRLITSNGYTLKEQDIISVRGKGKFRFGEFISSTKKGRCLVTVYRYI